MRNAEPTAVQPSPEQARALWQTPSVRALAASVAENNIGGAVPDAEGTS